jgi:hypothetical protein
LRVGLGLQAQYTSAAVGDGGGVLAGHIAENAREDLEAGGGGEDGAEH